MPNQDKIIGVYCILDDMLKSIGHQEDSRRKISDSEVLTTAIVSGMYFHGHLEHARYFMKMTGLVPDMIDKTRFNRRLHGLLELLYSLFNSLSLVLKTITAELEYVIDSFPVAVCDNMRIANCKLLKGKEWRGYTASMRRYFYGVKVQLIVTKDGIPVEFYFTPGSEADVTALQKLTFQFSPESIIYADSAYTHYQTEEDLWDAELVKLAPQRKKNSKRPDQPWMAYIKEHQRKRVETSISGIKQLFPRKIHAVTFNGFLLKIVLFIFAYTINKLAT
jgi:hypothetical protein